jgi:hypothetical protein
MTTRESLGDAERKARRDSIAREAYARLKRGQTYEDWRAVGEKLLDITEDVQIEQGVEKWDPDNKKLVREVTRRFEDWERSVSNEPVMGKDERNKLRVIMTDTRYHTWYMTLPGPERRRLNHPSGIIAKYKRLHEQKIKRLIEDVKYGHTPLDQAIGVMIDHLMGLDEDNQRAVLERLTQPFAYYIVRDEYKYKQLKKIEQAEAESLTLMTKKQRREHEREVKEGFREFTAKTVMPLIDGVLRGSKRKGVRPKR